MSITTHAELKTAIANWLKRANLTSYLDDFITLAEAQMNREFALFNPPLRALEQTQTGTISTETLALPSGYLGMKRLYVTIGGCRRALDYVSSVQATEHSIASLPIYYTTVGNNVVFAPPPSSSYDYEMVYLKKIDPLSAGSNWVIQNAPDLYLYGALIQAEPFIKNDARLPMWKAMYNQVLKSIEMANAKDRTSGSTLAIRSRNARNYS